MRVTFLKRIKKKVRNDVERGARESILEDLFNDFSRSRTTVYKFNFIRGIFFGLGSVLGGTVVLTLIIWLLNLTGHLLPGISGFVDYLVELMQHVKN